MEWFHSDIYGHRFHRHFQPYKTATKHTAQIVIVPGKRTPISGCKTVQDMGLVTMQTKKYECAAVTKDKLKTKEKYISEHHDVFNRELGTLDGTANLQLDPSVRPSALPASQIPNALRNPVKKELYTTPV